MEVITETDSSGLNPVVVKTLRITLNGQREAVWNNFSEVVESVDFALNDTVVVVCYQGNSSCTVYRSNTTSYTNNGTVSGTGVKAAAITNDASTLITSTSNSFQVRSNSTSNYSTITQNITLSTN